MADGDSIALLKQCIEGMQVRLRQLEYDVKELRDQNNALQRQGFPLQTYHWEQDSSSQHEPALERTTTPASNRPAILPSDSHQRYTPRGPLKPRQPQPFHGSSTEPEKPDSPTASEAEVQVSVEPQKRILTFLGSMPHDEQAWYNKRKSLGIDTPTGYMKVFNKVLLREENNYSISLTENGRTRPDFLEFLRKFGNSSAEAARRGGTPVESFRLLIFLAMCQVALEDKYARDEVLNIQREFHAELSGHPPPNNQTLRRYRRVVSWAVECSNEMYGKTEHGYNGQPLRERAFEMLLHGRLSII